MHIFLSIMGKTKIITAFCLRNEPHEIRRRLPKKSQ